MDSTSTPNELKELFKGLQSFIETETVFGKPYVVGNITLIPVNSVRLGFGLNEKNEEVPRILRPLVAKMDEQSSSSKEKRQLAGGGGLAITPLAFIVVNGEQVSIHNLGSGTIENVLDRLPVLLDKLKSIVVGEKKKEKVG